MFFILFDIISIPVAWFLACWFKAVVALFFQHGQVLLAVTLVHIACYYGFKVHRGLRCFSSSNDIVRIIRAVTLATLINLGLFYAFGWIETLLKSYLLLHSIFIIGLLSGIRLLARSYWESKNQQANTNTPFKRVLIIGAGRAGESLVRDIKRNPSYKAVGMLDDDLKKQQQYIRGVRVFGNIEQLDAIIKKREVNFIVIAIPSASSTEMQRIVQVCSKTKVPFSTLPSLSDITEGYVEVNMLKPVNIEDLLGRDQVKPDWHKVGQELQSQVVMVTGAGGSIGSELCHQIAKCLPAKLILLDASESNLFHFELELRKKFIQLDIETYLCSVTDKVAISSVFHCTKPSIVFHAAAYKHVPLLEHQTRVAVLNNVVGTRVVAEASVEANVEKFVLISTDKAVNPTNVMGTTKRVAEIFCQNLNEHVSTEFITVRFGNVLGSVGSVVPVFQKQLKAGGPLTVTHPDVQRYFMTVPEASQLILQAMVIGQGGEIFVLDMGEPIKITYLAEQMIRLAGKVPGKDIHIEFTGLRPGEKLFEELFHPSEGLKKTEHEKLFIARFRSVNWDELTETMKLIQSACERDDIAELLVLLRSLVPEFQAPKLQSEAEEVLTEV